MYPEAGPSRSGPYGGGKQPGRDQGSTPRQGSGRYEQEFEGYGRPQENQNRSFPNNSSPWSRPQSRQTSGFRPYPNGPPRARTPSPTRHAPDWDHRADARRPRSRERERSLDDRERPIPESSYRPPISNFNVPDRRAGGYVPPPQSRDGARELPPRDKERNRGPGPREDRYSNDDARSQPRRSFSPTKPPWPRDRPNPSPPKSRPLPPHIPWNGTPRANSNPRPPFQTPRDRDDRSIPERRAFHSRNSSGEVSRGGPGPASSAYQASTRSSPGATPPWTSRSVRGNSSPVESRHRAEDPVPVPVEESVPAPKVKVEVEEGELEEGEVMSSPVRPDTELSRQNDIVPAPQPRDRWREWPDKRGRPREPFDRNRERRWHAGPARSPERGGNRDTSVVPAQPWMMGQSVDAGWGHKGRVDGADQGRDEEKEFKEEPIRLPEVGEDEVVQEEDDRPATPPLPPHVSEPLPPTIPDPLPPVETTDPIPPSPIDSGNPTSAELYRPTSPVHPTITKSPVAQSNPNSANLYSPGTSATPHTSGKPTHLSPITTTSQLQSASDDILRPITPSIPAAGIPQQSSAVLNRPSPIPPSPQSSVPPRRTTDTPVAAYVPRQSAQPTGPAITVQHLIVPSQSVLSLSTDNIPSTIPSAAQITSPAKQEPISTFPTVSPQPVQPQSEISLSAKAEDVEMDSQATKVTPPSPPAVMDASTAPPTPRPAFSPLLIAGPRSPGLRQPTLAERRAVKLPSTQGPLSSPYDGRTPLRDPAPTNASQQDSTDSEAWPRTADMDEAQSEYSDGNPVVTREMRLLLAMRQAQKGERHLDVDAIVAWNLAAAPLKSARVPDLSPRKREKKLKEVSTIMGRQQRAVGILVAKQVLKEQERVAERTANLRKEYLMLDEEWREHCGYLDDLMEKRGPPPESLYAIPNAVPVVTPGPIPTTPIPLSEDAVSSRAIRRRGAGDAVTTEAEFQEILAAMADTAAKDPNYRASKTTAAVPDMLPLEERKLRFEDDNDIVDDPIAFYDFRGNAEPIWTEEERQVFVRRYLNFPKQFGKIAEAIPNKSASDCVLYYYRTKKEVDYKSMLASRRGVSKRKAIPLKKGGKSAALLASLDQKKDTVKARAAPTPVRARDDTLAPPQTAARRGGKPRMDTGPRRRMVDFQGDEGGEEGNSRDVSEVPSVPKVKRVSMKGSKRPRNSSMGTGQSTPGAGPSSTQYFEGGSSAPPQAELLPPVKRAKKVAKSKAGTGAEVGDTSIDGAEVSTPVPAPAGSTASIRRTVSSYWSIDEKKRMKDLFVLHQRDYRAIAAAMPGKSERQVANFCESHAADFGLEQEGEGTSTPGYKSPFTKEEYFKPAAAGEVRSRSIYDVYSQHSAPFATHEPRLGVFPSLPRTAASAPGGAIAAPAAPIPHRSPTQPVTIRSGGMRISALLNDDPLPLPTPQLDTRRDTGDAQSDGTVEDRDEGFRPLSRDRPISSSDSRRESIGIDQRAEMEGYRRQSHVGYMYQPQPPPSSASWQQQQQQQRRPSEAYYPRPPSPGPRISLDHPRSTESVPTRSHPYYPQPEPPHPHQQHSLPHRTMDYYRSRPDIYRSQTSNSDPYPPHQTSAPYPPANSGQPRDRYDHSRPLDWRVFRRTPPLPGQQPQHSHAHPVSAPNGRAGPGWYEDHGRQSAVLPGGRNMYEGDDGRGR